ncbi:uncharacterized protein PV09_04198 [Verruconis gallopava]|uniref:Uncharacterized protein n=1 Tax=Verruconis gallopava TaxID=253628 RepID=A0A0D1YWK3_9PEZI|nr:uncharacterized protein PV09_04198 [Verruconis gallopava]KIW05042.1 hypothetical protein PV09_04198 [Verruconis gallopava]
MTQSNMCSPTSRRTSPEATEAQHDTDVSTPPVSVSNSNATTDHVDAEFGGSWSQFTPVNRPPRKRPESPGRDGAEHRVEFQIEGTDSILRRCFEASSSREMFAIRQATRSVSREDVITAAEAAIGDVNVAKKRVRAGKKEEAKRRRVEARLQREREKRRKGDQERKRAGERGATQRIARKRQDEGEKR